MNYNNINQPNPFARRESPGYPAEDHYHRFATRDAKTRLRAAGGDRQPGGSRTANVSTGTQGFGAKAEVQFLSVPAYRKTTG